jgi:SAM-dependent methyltransferase
LATSQPYATTPRKWLSALALPRPASAQTEGVTERFAQIRRIAMVITMADVRGHPFQNVDGDGDYTRWIGVLDRLSCDPLYRPYKSRVVELLAPRAGDYYLDVGCGTGATACAVADQFGCRVAGLDSSKVMIAEARSRGLADAVVGDAHDLPFADEAFDGALADRTFQHLTDPVTALREIARVVKKGGVVVIADPDYSRQTLSIADQQLGERVLSFRADYGIRNGTSLTGFGTCSLRTG